MQLFSRTGYNIGVYYDGIRGTQADDDLHSMYYVSFKIHILWPM